MAVVQVSTVALFESLLAALHLIELVRACSYVRIINLDLRAASSVLGALQTWSARVDRWKEAGAVRAGTHVKFAAVNVCIIKQIILLADLHLPHTTF